MILKSFLLQTSSLQVLDYWTLKGFLLHTCPLNSVLTCSCNFHFFFLCCHFYSSCVVLLWICFLSSSLLVLDYWILIQKNILICLYMKCKMKLLKKMSLMKSFLCNFWTLSGGVGKTRLSKKKKKEYEYI